MTAEEAILKEIELLQGTTLGRRWKRTLAGFPIVFSAVLTVAACGSPPEPSAFSIPEHGRLTIDASALPSTGSVSFTLGLSDEARGDDVLKAVIATVDGRRLETAAKPIPGVGTGIRLQVDDDFLVPGRYMIQVATAEKHPLNFRRYVLEIR